MRKTKRSKEIPYYVLCYADTGEIISEVKFPKEEWDLDRYIRAGFADILDAPIKAVMPKDREETEEKLKSDDWVLQHKLDGVRARCYIGKRCNRFFGGSIVKSGFYAEYTDNIPHLRELPLSQYSGTLLDGELIHPSGIVPDKKTPGVVNSLPQTAWDKQATDEFLIYIVYDITRYKGVDVRKFPYHERLQLIYNIMYGNEGNVWHECFLPIITVDKSINYEGMHFSKKQYLEYIFENGLEGCILKRKSAPYTNGDTNDLQKVKLEKTYDVVITGSEPASKYYTDPKTGKEDKTRLTKYYAEGLIGKITYGVFASSDDEALRLVKNGGKRVKKFGKNKILVEIGKCSGMNDDFRREFTKNQDKYLYEVLKVKANGIVDTAKGSLRHPRYVCIRKDKSMFDCTFKRHLRAG
jgi:ATP-dependent DNA ligase